MKRLVLVLTMLSIVEVNCLAQKGEIIYNDSFEPREMHADEPWPNNHRFFDFDNDSLQDFFIAWTAYREWHIIAYTYGSWWYERQIMEVGDTISNVPNWFPEPANPDYDPIIQFNPGYSRDSIIIGFKRQVEEDSFCYGWIRFSLDAGPEKNYKLASDNRVPWAHGICTFIDYAYCTEPNYPLRAGQTSFDWDVLESNFSTSRTTIYPNPTTDQVTLDVEQEGDFSISVFDTNGKLVLRERNANVVSFKDRPAGLYHIVVEQNGQRWSRKIIKL